MLPLTKYYNVTTRKGACYTMKLSANQAAKQVGKSVPTITRAIKSGRLTADKKDGGGYSIDASELFRVWPKVTETPDATPTMLNDTTPNDTRVLEVELNAKSELMERMQGEIDDLREQRDKWQSQAERQTLLLEKQEGRGGLFSLFKKKG